MFTFARYEVLTQAETQAAHDRNCRRQL
jgi:hypothetical protein